MRQNTIMINEAWPSTLFLCDWVLLISMPRG